jgi:aspartate aminotransferase
MAHEMGISNYIAESIHKSSWIRKMFEEGAQLKSVHGVENVFDFSLGNPSLLPPPAFETALLDIVRKKESGAHAYMPNSGYPSVRKAVADQVSIERGMDITENDIVMTCGAAGGLNVALKTLLDRGDEVLVPTPYFVEYGFYADNHGGVLKPVPTHADFTLDIDAVSAALTEKTRVFLINSPNNPTGQIYSRESIAQVGELLKRKSKEFGRIIYLLSDEPYLKLVYDGLEVPDIFSAYDNSLVVMSYSKDLSIPGERIGYIAINPRAVYRKELSNGLSLSNRILGFVSAPALMQRVVGAIQGSAVDISAYAKKREHLCRGLIDAGYELVIPPGAFYAFPKAPIENEIEFVMALREELILTVPGRGFGCPGYFRIAYCVSDDIIAGALPGFGRVMARYK